MGIITRLRTPKAEHSTDRLGTQGRTRMYQAAKQSRLTAGWTQGDTSADSELHTSLSPLRQRSRALIRDSGYAKRARTIVVNNVVGSGIGLQAQVMTARGELNEAVNTAIETAWKRWSQAESCHTGGTLHFSDIERTAMAQVFDAGEVLIRKHYSPFGRSDVPFALELIEPERLADQFQPYALMPGTRVRMGIETDRFHRPIAYWIRSVHPGELRQTAEETSEIKRVPADQIIHLRIIDRWPQTRGEPWMHTAARKLNDMDGYSEAEIVRARGAANYMGFVSTEEEYGETTRTGDKEIVMEPGLVARGGPGEKMEFNNPDAGNPNMDAFMRYMIREVAAGIGVSYESLSRDYSQSNYSGSRMGLLDDRDLWRVLQQWFIRSFRDLVHREWLSQAVLSRAIRRIGIDEYSLNPEKFEAARYKPRGWTWVDPAKEVKAYREAVRSGFTTNSDVIAQTGAGRDLEDVLKERKRELEMMKEMGLEFDTDPAVEPEEESNRPPDDDDDDQADKTNQNDRRLAIVEGSR